MPFMMGSGTEICLPELALSKHQDLRYACHGSCHPILITSQLPLENWHDIIGDPTIADAILDRIVHNAHRIELEGESLRKIRDQNDQV